MKPTYLLEHPNVVSIYIVSGTIIIFCSSQIDKCLMTNCYNCPCTLKLHNVIFNPGTGILALHILEPGCVCVVVIAKKEQQ